MQKCYGEYCSGILAMDIEKITDVKTTFAYAKYLTSEKGTDKFKR